MRRGWLLCGVGLLLAGCSLGPKSEELEALLERTLESLVFVEGGTFMMGWDGDFNTHPIHEVTLDSYSMQKYEVTYEEYDLFTRATRREMANGKYLGERFRQPTQPATGMTWSDARAYCQWLGELSGLPFDLPTEAQWEYAARSRGKDVLYATDDGTLDFGHNYRERAQDRVGRSWADPPGTYPPNPLGLYDMTGNAAEWVLDWYGRYTAEPKHNPQGPETGKRKIMRGSAWIGTHELKVLRRRAPLDPENDGAGAGIRCVVNVAQPVERGR